MKSAVFAVVAVAVLTFSSAEDDGQYHPELYGDDGQYRPDNDGQYNARLVPYKVYTAFDNQYQKYLGKNGKYNSIYSAYQPVFLKNSPSQEILTPLVTYGDHNSIVDQQSFAAAASSLSSVTYRPTAFRSSASPVFSKPAPLAISSTTAPFLKSYDVPVYAKNYYNNQNAKIVRQDTDIDPDSYHYLYKTDNGIEAEESGALGPRGGTQVKGFYEYVGDDGRTYRVDYVADENGYRASGAHLPHQP